MRMLLVLAHPMRESFAYAVHRSAVTGLERAGHEVRILDLYAMGFDPVMSAEDRLNYHTPGENETPVAEHLDHLRWAEGLVFVYPTWWYSMPAMLKGWIDRVWVPHATFDLPKGLAPIQGRLHNIRVIGGFSTYGSPWWWVRFVIGDPGRRIVLRGVRPLCHPGCGTFWLGHYRMDSSTAASRAAFLTKVEALAAKL
jgi:NAD(P)H dehydrogenase (quinone)